MRECEQVDYSGRNDSLIVLYKCPSVTAEDLSSIKEVLPDHSSHVYEGDVLTIYIVDNRTEGIEGLLSIWHRKEKARFNTGGRTIWGDWNEEAGLLVTEDFAEAGDMAGAAITGRIAYNSHGIRGIYSEGRFFTLTDHDLLQQTTNGRHEYGRFA